MARRIRHILAMLAAGPGLAAVASAEPAITTQDVIDARLVVGAFGRLCVGGAAGVSAFEQKAVESRSWKQISAQSIAMPDGSAVPDKAWRATLNGGAIDYQPFYGAAEDGETFVTCGVGFPGLPAAAMKSALDASGLFEKAGEGDAFCVSTYPVAASPHEIRLTTPSAPGTDPALVMIRGGAGARGCPIT